MNQKENSPSETGTASSKIKPSIYQLKITLKHTKPPVWRRIQVLSDISFKELHYHIQAAMGWRDCHLHQFGCFTPRDFSLSDDSDEEEMVENQRISTYFKDEGDRTSYLYDFGDGWDHIVTLEKIMPYTGEEGSFPKLIKGKRACPPEDCGGVYGYENLLKIYLNPKHPEFDELIVDWLNDLYPDWHPDKFNENPFFLF